MNFCFCIEAKGGAVTVSDGHTGALLAVIAPGERTSVGDVSFGLTHGGIFTMCSPRATERRDS